MKFYRWMVMGSLVLRMSLGFADLSVSVKPNPSHVNEEMMLTIRQQGNHPAAKLPDLSMLAQDFQILGSQQSMSYQNYNGQIRHENTWTILLLPKHAGKFTIPSLNLNGEQSSPQNIEVLPLLPSQTKPQVQIDTTPAVFMRWELEPKEAFVHQQLKMKIEIYHAVPLMDAKLSPPQVENALLFHLDESRHRTEIFKGQDYEVETYEYLLFPQKVGDLKIQPPSLDALEYEYMPNPIHLREAAKTIHVEASTAQALKNLSFKVLDSQQGSQPINLGDTFTREFEVEAQGLPYQMMPKFSASCGKDCKVYVQNTANKNEIKAGDVIGRQHFSISYLPQKVGEVAIQDIVIPWFNTQTKQTASLVIPGMKLRITSNSLETPSSQISTINPQTKQQNLPSWAFILLGGLAGIVMMLGLTYLPRLKLQRRFYLGSPIKRACYKNSVSELRPHLINWAKKRFPEAKIYDLHDILSLDVSKDFKIVLNDLIEHVYGKNQQRNSWNGTHFWKIFSQFERRRKNKSSREIPVNRLNPD